MIETGKVDLQEGFEIEFVDCDCGMDFLVSRPQPVQDLSCVFEFLKE
jgi:hypothetical protein